MPEVLVEKIKDFAEGDRRIVFHDGSEIGVFHWLEDIYATSPAIVQKTARLLQ